MTITAKRYTAVGSLILLTVLRTANVIDQGVYSFLLIIVALLCIYDLLRRGHL